MVSEQEEETKIRQQSMSTVTVTNSLHLAGKIQANHSFTALGTT